MTTTATRFNVLSAIYNACDISAALVAAGIDPEEGRAVADKLIANVAPQKNAHTGNSATHRRNVRLFLDVVKPYLEGMGGAATAKEIATWCEGLPVGAKGTPTTQAVTAILRAGMTDGHVRFADEDVAKAYRKEHKVSGKPSVYQLA